VVESEKATSVAMVENALRQERADGWMWQLAGSDAAGFGLMNDYLGYLADRNYSQRTVRAYGFDLLAFCRWLVEQGLGLDVVTTVVLLDFCARAGRRRCRGDRRECGVDIGAAVDRYAAATINHRLAAISGLFAFRQMRDPDASNPVPKGWEARSLKPSTTANSSRASMHS
jgi:integrase/recombinase XerD